MAIEVDDASVVIADDAEIHAAVGRNLDEIGLSFEELEDQARRDEFSSDCARRLWFMISPLGGE